MPARIQLSCKNQLRRRVFSQAVPKRCQWKIDVWIRESFRRQNGSDAGPGSFELRVFLRGLRQKQHWLGAAVQHGAFKRDSTKDFALRPPWHRRALMAIVWKMWLFLPKGKVAVDYSLQASLTFRGRRRYIRSSPRCWSCITHRNYVFHSAFTKSRRMNSKTFSQAGPKRCQWKIDVWIRESFRRQNGSDAGPESFELRVFLRGLRQKQHWLGAAVQHGAFKRDSTNDFALRPPWHRRALMAIVWKMWLSLPNGKGAVDYSLQASLTFRGRRRYIWSSPRCWSCITHRNYVFHSAFTKSRRMNSKTFIQAGPKRCQWKIDVWIRESFRRQNGSDAGPESFELRVFLRGLRQKQHWLGAAVQHGAFKRDSTKDFALRPPWHRRALMAIVWKMWPSLPNGKGAVDYSLQASLTFRGRRRYIWSSPRCWSCITHRNYVFHAAFTKSRRMNSVCGSSLVLMLVSV